MTEKNKHLDNLIDQELLYMYKLDETRDQIKAERDRMAFELYGIRVGVVVLYRNHEYCVTDVNSGDIRSKWGGKPWVKGQKKLKDGTFGSLSHRLYDSWKFVTDSEVKK